MLPSSVKRLAAGASGFFTLIQALLRPDRYLLSRRLLTMPSKPGADMLEHQRAVEFEVFDVAQAVTSNGACERSQELVEPRLAVDQS